MRAGYLRELFNLRDQILSKDKLGRKFEYLEVRYFESTLNLDTEMCFVLNKKLDELKNDYELILTRMTTLNN
jgi:hypothetical protein